jgi:starch synthase
MLGVPEKNIKVVRYGVDINKYVPGDGAKENDLILWASRIDPIKGLHVLLKSLKYIDRPIHLAILGVRNNDFHDYFEEISRMVDQEIKAGKHKITFTQSITGDDLIPWYQKASLFAIPYTADPVFPLVNLEALACGTPIVSSRVGGVAELIEDEVNGLLVPPNDPAELSKAITRMLEDDALRKRCGRNGRALIERSFSWERVSSQLYEIYCEMACPN